jgi:hypothetical protein
MTALLTETTRDLTTRLGEELRRREGERLRRQVLRDLVHAQREQGHASPRSMRVG